LYDGNNVDKEGEEQGSNLDNKQRIYNYIKNNPGAHLRRISKELNIVLGDIQYQLKSLENTSLIRSRRMGLYKTYYTVSILGERNEKISAILQQETPRDIILYLIENPGATHNQIAHHKGFTAPTINWHMSRLIQIGLVYSHREQRFTKYYLKGSIQDIVDLLKLYHPSLWNKLSYRLAELFLDLADKSKLQRNGEVSTSYHNKDEDTLYEEKGGENNNNIDKKIQL
jgi:predicted ArsR family transcriptional regulator